MWQEIFHMLSYATCCSCLFTGYWCLSSLVRPFATFVIEINYISAGDKSRQKISCLFCGFSCYGRRIEWGGRFGRRWSRYCPNWRWTGKANRRLKRWKKKKKKKRKIQALTSTERLSTHDYCWLVIKKKKKKNNVKTSPCGYRITSLLNR